MFRPSLKDFIGRYLPKRFDVCSGFIAGQLLTRQISPEIDIFVSDFSNAPPIHNEGSIQIARASSVLAAIEVKSSFNSVSLGESSSHFAAVNQITRSSVNETWHGIFFFDSENSTEYDFGRAIYDRFNSDLFESNGLVRCAVVILGIGIAFYKKDATATKLRYFKLGSLSAGLWILDMLSWITEQNGVGWDNSDILECIPELIGKTPAIFQSGTSS